MEDFVLFLKVLGGLLAAAVILWMCEMAAIRIREKLDGRGDKK